MIYVDICPVDGIQAAISQCITEVFTRYSVSSRSVNAAEATVEKTLLSVFVKERENEKDDILVCSLLMDMLDMYDCDFHPFHHRDPSFLINLLNFACIF